MGENNISFLIYLRTNLRSFERLYIVSKKKTMKANADETLSTKVEYAIKLFR